MNPQGIAGAVFPKPFGDREVRHEGDNGRARRG